MTGRTLSQDVPGSAIRFPWRKLFRFSILPLGILVFSLSGCANRMFFHPDNRVWDQPQRYGLQPRDVTFPSDDGTQLHGWWFPSKGTAKGTIVHFHGNAGNVSAHFHGSAWLTQAGYQVLVFDYRGYGSSKGTTTRKGVVRDSAAAIRYVLNRDDVQPDRLFLLGQSLGGMAALNGAILAQVPVSGYLIDSAFSKHRKIASEKARQLPLGLGWILQPLVPLLISGSYDPIDALDRIPEAPILFLHGTGDRVIPHHHSEILHRAAGKRSDLFLIEGGRHTDSWLHPDAQRRILDFLE